MKKTVMLFAFKRSSIQNLLENKINYLNSKMNLNYKSQVKNYIFYNSPNHGK